MEHPADQLPRRPPRADDVALALEQLAPPRVEQRRDADGVDRAPHQRLAVLEAELPGREREQAAGAVVGVAPLPALELERAALERATERLTRLGLEAAERLLRGRHPCEADPSSQGSSRIDPAPALYDGSRGLRDPSAGTRLPLLPPRSALLLGVFALVLEVSLITPWVDDAADSNSTVHFTQHGLIFIGGLLMGWALRDLRLATLFAAERR